MTFRTSFAFLVAGTMVASGAEPEKPYKNTHRDQITAIAKGKTTDAKAFLEEYLAQHPEDLEVHYGLAICYAQQGKIAEAVELAKRGVEKGLPLGRFLAGPRDLLKPLTSSPQFQAWTQQEGIQLIHGPTLGNVTDSSASFWVRTWHEVPFQVTAHAATSTDRSKSTSAAARTRANRDFTGIATLTGLAPDTQYTYQLTVDGQALPDTYDFRTMPTRGRPARFTIMFGGGAGFTPWKERMWDVVDSHQPLAYLALGDNVYIDTPKVQATQQYCYYRRQSRPEYRNFVSSTPLFAIWDDHDFTSNDGQGGPEIENPPWKRDVWNTFKNNFVNPSYGGGRDQPGCWFSCSIANVDFFLIDGRYYRDRKGGSMLGPVQKRWLLQSLKNSEAAFKVLCVDVPITPGVKPGSKDTWDGFPEEREEILTLVESNGIDGFFVISADRHRSDAWKTERESGYPIYEFQSSRLTNVHKHGLIEGCIFGYNQKCSFALLTFDTSVNDPTVTYDVWNIDNEKVHSLTIARSELSADH